MLSAVYAECLNKAIMLSFVTFQKYVKKAQYLAKMTLSKASLSFLCPYAEGNLCSVLFF
jgi:hypothetical protein